MRHISSSSLDYDEFLKSEVHLLPIFVFPKLSTCASNLVHTQKHLMHKWTMNNTDLTDSNGSTLEVHMPASGSHEPH